MATKLTVSGTINATFLKNALLTIGDILAETLYETGEYLIFKTPFSNKVFKIRITNGYDPYIFFSYGTSWTSGTTLVGEVGLMNSNPTSYGTPFTQMIVIASSEHFCIYLEGTIDFLIYAGKLSNGDTVAFGGSVNYVVTGYYNTAYQVENTIAYKPIPIYINSQIQSANNKIFSLPLHWYNASGNMIMNNSVPATTKGLKQTLAKTAQSFIGPNYFLTSSQMYFDNARRVFYTSLLLEFDEVV